MSTFVGLVLLAALTLAVFQVVLYSSRQPADAHPPTIQAAAQADRVDDISAAVAIQLGPSAANVADLAVGDDAVYTLDVAEGSVRAFALDGLNQQPGPETLVARAGAALDTAGRRLGLPVAIEYLAPPGLLAIVDQSRAVVQVGRDRSLNIRTVPTSAGWQQLGALGSDQSGHLLFLDSGSRQLLEYPPLSQNVVDPPRIVVDGRSTPGLSFDRVTQVVAAGDATVARLEDGTVQRLDAVGGNQPVALGWNVAAIAADRAGGLYLADPAHARILQTTLDGSVLRELHDPTLAGVRQIQTSLDGRRMYGLVASGVLVFDLPST